jgi:tetratricopeptide (TPR) repeat protein
MKIIVKFLLLIFLLSFFVIGCAPAPEIVQPERPTEVPPPQKPKEKVVPTAREQESLEIFTEILDIIESSEDRQSVLPQVEELYDRIIREYPDTPLAQESYWKLITIYMEDYSPPDFEKAETRYTEFIKKYPNSILRGMVEDTLGKGYYKNAKWEELLRLCTPVYKDYIEKGKHPRASLIFMYSEANYNLGNLEEAEKGYRIVAELFPKLIVGKKSKAMLEKMKKVQK